jgi:hypothetical protein
MSRGRWSEDWRSRGAHWKVATRLAMRWSSAALNPYQPPQCSEPAAEVAGAAVMQVRYSLGYSLGLTFSGAMMMVSAAGADGFFPPWLLFPLGAFFLVGAVVTWRKAFFEVFENRIEMVPPFFPKRGRRHPRPLESIGSGSLLFRWAAKREDFKCFIAWRSQRELPSAR